MTASLPSAQTEHEVQKRVSDPSAVGDRDRPAATTNAILPSSINPTAASSTEKKETQKKDEKDYAPFNLSLYDLLFLLLRSLGRFLPWVIFIALAGAGGIYVYRELKEIEVRAARERSATEKELLQLELKKAELEAGIRQKELEAENAADRAMSSRVKSTGQLSLDLAESLQSLIKGQVDNMAGLETATRRQIEAEQARIKELERERIAKLQELQLQTEGLAKERREKIETLDRQISTLESDRLRLQEQTATALYRASFGSIQTVLSPENRSGRGTFTEHTPLLRESLKSAASLQLAKRDLEDGEIYWIARVRLALELTVVTGSQEHLEKAGLILAQNAHLIDDEASLLLVIYRNAYREVYAPLVSWYVDLSLDKRYPTSLRFRAAAQSPVTGQGLSARRLVDAVRVDGIVTMLNSILDSRDFSPSRQCLAVLNALKIYLPSSQRQCDG